MLVIENAALPAYYTSGVSTPSFCRPIGALTVGGWCGKCLVRVLGALGHVRLPGRRRVRAVRV